MVVVLLIVGAFFLAWSNGANDNFKGVATLYGSGTASFRTALIWATAAAAVGSLLSVFMADKLALAFSGKGLVPDTSIGPGLLAAVGSAAAVTILLAIGLTAGAYSVLRRFRRRLGVLEESCLCVSRGDRATAMAIPGG